MPLKSCCLTHPWGAPGCSLTVGKEGMEMELIQGLLDHVPQLGSPEQHFSPLRACDIHKLSREAFSPTAPWCISLEIVFESK